MGKILSDAEVGLASSSKALSDEDVGLGPAEPARKTVFSAPPDVPMHGMIGMSVADALAIAEQPAAGLYGMGAEAYAGTKALFKSGIAKFAGLPLADTFKEEYNKAKDELPEYVPLTPGGAALSEKVSHVMESALKAYGDIAYQTGQIVPTPVSVAITAAKNRMGMKTESSPISGALGEAAAMLATLLAGPGAMKGKAGKSEPIAPKSAVDVIAEFDAKYPRTKEAIDASRVGKFSVGPVEPGNPLQSSTKRVLDAVNEALDAELKVSPDMDKLAGIKDAPLGDKLRLLIMKYTPEVPVSDQIKFANAQVTKLLELQTTQDAIIAQRPRLPAPGQEGKAVIEVDTQGNALTHEQSLAEQARFNAFMNENKTVPIESGDVSYTAFTKRMSQKFNRNLSKLRKKEAGSIDIEGMDDALYANNAAVLSALENGTMAGPLIAYHGTQSEFGPGQYTAGRGIGPHFGSLAQAHDFVKDPYTQATVWDTVDMKGMQERMAKYNPETLGIPDDPQTAYKYPREYLEATRDKLYQLAPSPERKADISFIDRQIHGLYTYGTAMEGGNIRPVDLWFKKPARMGDGVWEDPHSVVGMLVTDDIITNGEANGLSSKINRITMDAREEMKASGNHFLSEATVQRLKQEQFDVIRQALQNKGYDSIVYKNGSEGQRHDLGSSKTDSYIALYPKEQVKYRNSREQGSIDIQGMEENVPKAKAAAEKATAKSWTGGNAQSADRALEDTYASVDESAKAFSVATLKSVRKAVVAHDYDLEHGLQKAGPAGDAAFLTMNVEHNATMKAKTRYDKAVQSIFDDLSSGETKTLEKIVRLRRIVQIDQYKGIGAIKHEIDPITKKNITGPDAKAALDKMQADMGDIFTKLDSRATAVFTEEKVNLRRLVDEGLIDEKTYSDLKNLDYTREAYMEAIDPSITTSKGKTISSSGIPLIGTGKRAMSMDARGLLKEDIARVENRIARNDTLKALYGLAESNPGNGIVALGDKAARGYQKLDVWIDGSKKSFVMKQEFADQFGYRPDVGNKSMFRVGDYDVTLNSILRTVSGASLVRATATTYDPLFIFAGLPMDILHTWLATNKVYSPHLPVYLMQMGKDLGVTFKDAITKSGQWTQAVSEGMAPTFLTHESRGLLTNVNSAMEPKLQSLRTALSYMGDFQDMWVRLAHRNRLIEQGIPPAEATARAVARLNYSRGGQLTSFVDTVVPYTRITVNAGSRVIENAAADPKGSLAKVAWITGTVAALKLANMIASPETDKQISGEEQARSFILTFGDQQFTIDPDGSKRYLYCTVRADQSAMPILAAVTSGMNYAEYGKIPEKNLSSAIGQVLPLTGGIPAYQAYKAYMDNYDSYRDSPIYQGMKVRPEDQIRSFAKGQQTSQTAQMAGKALGMSPMGIDAAASQLLNTNNFWIQMMGGGTKLMFEGMDPRQQAESTMQMLQAFPGVRKLCKLTTPGLTQMHALQEAEKDAGSKLSAQIKGVDEAMFKFQHDQMTKKELEQYMQGVVQGLPPEQVTHIKDHAKYTYQVDKVMRKFEASDKIPPKVWWIASSKILPEARAQVFYNEWVSKDPEDRKRMEAIAGGLQQAGTGYMGDAFRRELAKNIQMLGREQR